MQTGITSWFKESTSGCFNPQEQVGIIKAMCRKKMGKTQEVASQGWDGPRWSSEPRKLWNLILSPNYRYALGLDRLVSARDVRVSVSPDRQSSRPD